MTTADQDEWKEIAQAIRAQVRRYAEQMPAMKPDEIKTFVEAANDAMWLEVYASTFDKEIELRLAKLFQE